MLHTLVDHASIRVADVDYFAEIWIIPFLNFLLRHSHSQLHIYSDTDERTAPVSIQHLFKQDRPLPVHARMETVDGSLMIVDDFDQRFTYFMGKRSLIDGLIEALDLEGFYANHKINESWSYEPVPEGEQFADEAFKHNYWSRFDT